MMTKNGLPKRQNTFIDIPESLRLPHFMMLDEKPQELANGLSTEYKLVLQSVVCHRGESLHSGHYIAFCRIAPKLMTDNRRHDSDPPPDYEEAQWVKFDDLLLENRVSHVEDIKQALKAEMPYLLFYQIVPMVDVTATSDVSEAEPPSYQDVTINASVSEPVADADRSHASTRRNSGYFDVAAPDGPASTGPDVRLSPDIDRPSRTSLAVDDDSSYALAASQSNNTQGTTNTGASDDAFRRGSVGLSETTGVTTPANTPDPVPNVPSGTPGAGGDESTAQRLSRAASRFTKTPSAGGAAGSSGSRSRPESQTGEGRISLTSRLGGLMRSSREPLRDATPGNGSQAPNAPTLGESVVVDDTVPAVPLIPPDAESMPAKNLDPAIGGAVPGATTPTTPGSGHHNHHHHHSHSHKKDKGKGKEKEKTFKLNKQGLPERECTVM